MIRNISVTQNGWWAKQIAHSRDICNPCEWMNVFMLIMRSKGRGWGVFLKGSGHQSLEWGEKTTNRDNAEKIWDRTHHALWTLQNQTIWWWGVVGISHINGVQSNHRCWSMYMHNMLHVNTLWVKENNSYLTTLRWMQNISKFNMNDLIIHYFLKQFLLLILIIYFYKTNFSSSPFNTLFSSIIL